MVNSFTPAVQDFDLAVGLGVIKNTNNSAYRSFVKFGRNPDVRQGWEGVRAFGGSFQWPTMAGKVKVRAGGSADDIFGGNGAHDIQITGIDSDLEIRTEVINLNGVNASVDSVFDYWRVYSVQVVHAGKYTGANASEILLDVSNAPKAIGILADEGRSQYGSVSIPKEHTGVFTALTIAVEGNKNVNVRVFARSEFTNTTTPRSKVLVRSYSQVPAGLLTVPFFATDISDELTDIWIEAQVASGTSSVSINAPVLLVPNR